jgi:beta-fructofuranosidase
MAIAGVNSAGKSAIVRFQGDDLSSWEKIQEITSTLSNEPQEYEITTDSDITECPDIFKMGERWYCVFSRINSDWQRKTFYRVADNPNGPWRVPIDENGAAHQTFDGLYLYAAKTVSNGGNSAGSGNGTARYVCGWASSGQKFNSWNQLDWGGMLITHKLLQQPHGALYPAIPDAVDTKFSKAVTFKDILRNGTVSGTDSDFILGENGSVVFSRSPVSCKIEMKIDASDNVTGGFGIAFGAYENQQDIYKISFDLTSNNEFGLPSLFMHQKNAMYNSTPLIVPANKQFDVKIIMEKQVCVMYINGNVAFTNHITNLERNPWMIFNDNGSVHFYDIKVYTQ